jgi:hypothetical protein
MPDVSFREFQFHALFVNKDREGPATQKDPG